MKEQFFLTGLYDFSLGTRELGLKCTLKDIGTPLIEDVKNGIPDAKKRATTVGKVFLTLNLLSGSSFASTFILSSTTFAGNLIGDAVIGATKGISEIRKTGTNARSRR